MEKKKRVIFCLIIVLIGIFNLSKKGKCNSYAICWYFNVDKTTYYNDEFIYVNTSYDLVYDSGVDSYIQLQIRDPNNEMALLWNSSRYSEEGTHIYKEWYVKISDLPIAFNNTSNDLAVIFYYLYDDGSKYEDYVETRIVQTIKRNISCDLIDFKQNINYGDVLEFKARFYSIENNSNLVNHLITIKIVSNNIMHYINNYTTNSTGMIDILIPTAENITTGIYQIKIEAMGNEYYEKSTFEYLLLINSTLDDEVGIGGSNSKNQDEIYSNTLPFIFSIISISALAFLIIYHNNIRKTKQRDLADLTFKY